MAIAWGRGFFRVWVLLAVVWLVVDAVHCWQLYDTRGVGDSYAFIEGRGDLAWAYGSSEFQAALKAKNAGNMQELIGKDTPYVTIFFNTRPDNNFADVVRHYDPLRIEFYKTKIEEGREKIVTGGFVLAVFVPLTVLLVGWALGWAISGFRRRPLSE